MGNLADKLQIKPGKRWLFYNAPVNYWETLQGLPGDTEISSSQEGKFDGVQLFVKDRGALAADLEIIVPILKPDTVFWVTYPKKSSGILSDLEMTGSWDELAKYGLRVVSAASVNETWTALRLRPVGQSKLSDSRNEAIKKNEYAEFIDVDKKQIKLPEDIQLALENAPAAMAYYQSLSYSNKREYVVWILSAKLEQTKTERLLKMVEKLAAGKKNPFQK
jgi:hypothetical protein